MPRTSSTSRVRIAYTNPGDERILLFSVVVEVDSDLVREHGISWHVRLKTSKGRPGKGQITWYRGDLNIIQDELDLFYTKLALEATK